MKKLPYIFATAALAIGLSIGLTSCEKKLPEGHHEGDGHDHSGHYEGDGHEHTAEELKIIEANKKKNN